MELLAGSDGLARKQGLGLGLGLDIMGGAEWQRVAESGRVAERLVINMGSPTE